MAKLTITDAARVTGVSRMLLYRYIKAGKLSRTPDGLIDTAELLRAGLMLQTSDVTIPVTPLHEVTSSPVTPETPVTTTVTSAVTPPGITTGSSETRTLERLIDVLQRELDAARERETLVLAGPSAKRPPRSTSSCAWATWSSCSCDLFKPNWLR